MINKKKKTNFKKGDILKCINNDTVEKFITDGSVYEAICSEYYWNRNNPGYKVKVRNDNGKKFGCFSQRFELYVDGPDEYEDWDDDLNEEYKMISDDNFKIGDYVIVKKLIYRDDDDSDDGIKAFLSKTINKTGVVNNIWGNLYKYAVKFDDEELEYESNSIGTPLYKKGEIELYQPEDIDEYEEWDDDPVNEEYDYDNDIFEVGDKVTIKHNLKEGDNYMFYVNSYMECLKGKNTTIMHHNNIDQNIYKIDADNKEWDWSSDMLEPYAPENIDEYENWDEINEEIKYDTVTGKRVYEGFKDPNLSVGDRICVINTRRYDKYKVLNKYGNIIRKSTLWYGIEFDDPIENYRGKGVPGGKSGHCIWLRRGSDIIKIVKIEKIVDEYEDWDDVNESVNHPKKNFKKGDILIYVDDVGGFVDITLGNVYVCKRDEMKTGDGDYYISIISDVGSDYLVYSNMFELCEIDEYEEWDDGVNEEYDYDNNKFEIGDKVKIKGNRINSFVIPYHNIKIGDVGIIQDIDTGGSIDVKSPSFRWIQMIYREDLELVEPEEIDEYEDWDDLNERKLLDIFNLYMDPDLGYSDDKVDFIKSFLTFTFNYLKVEGYANIILTANKDGIPTTACYSNRYKTIKIYSKNRMLVDIFRSLAHELVHKRQYEEGKITYRPPDIGGPIEDEANAKAGVIIKLFLKETSSDDRIFEKYITK